MREVQPVSVTWLLPFASVIAAILALGLYPMLGFWSAVPAIAAAALAEHQMATFFGRESADWRNALLGTAAGAVGAAIALLIARVIQA